MIGESFLNEMNSENSNVAATVASNKFLVKMNIIIKNRNVMPEERKK